MVILYPRYELIYIYLLIYVKLRMLWNWNFFYLKEHFYGNIVSWLRVNFGSPFIPGIAHPLLQHGSVLLSSEVAGVDGPLPLGGGLPTVATTCIASLVTLWKHGELK